MSEYLLDYIMYHKKEEPTYLYRQMYIFIGPPNYIGSLNVTIK